MTKNKTLAAWLALLGGPLGLHRFYLHGLGDTLAWLLPIFTALGLHGLERAYQYGQDDGWSWVLLPVLGLTISVCALTAIVYGLRSAEQWNARHNPQLSLDAAAGRSNWLTIGALVCALLIGATALMSTLAYGFQRYFEYQIEAARQMNR